MYRQRMQEKGLDPNDIRTIDDLKYLPFTQKTDLRDNYPFGLFAASRDEIVRLHASSGTTGKPIVVGYTQNDPGCMGGAHGARPHFCGRDAP